VQLGVNKATVITCAAQLLKVLGVGSLTEGSFMAPSTRLIPALNGFLDGQLVLLLFIFLFELLLLLLVSLVFILLAAFISHCVSPFLAYYLAR